MRERVLGMLCMLICVGLLLLWPLLGIAVMGTVPRSVPRWAALKFRVVTIGALLAAVVAAAGIGIGLYTGSWAEVTCRTAAYLVVAVAWYSYWRHFDGLYPSPPFRDRRTVVVMMYPVEGHLKQPPAWPPEFSDN